VITTNDPAIGVILKRLRFQRPLGSEPVGMLAKVTQNKASGLPDLVAKVAVSLNTALRQLHVVSRRRAGQESKAQRVQPVLLDDEQRIIPPGIFHGLGYLLSLLVAHEPV